MWRVGRLVTGLKVKFSSLQNLMVEVVSCGQGPMVDGSIVRRRLLVAGRPTELLTLGPGPEDNPSSVVLIIPGNPGVASYYARLMECLYSGLDRQQAVWTVSHAGHCLPHPSHAGVKGVYDLEDQVAHKVGVVEELVPPGASLTLVGHSIGSYIILRLLRHLQAHPQLQVNQSFLLFPTIERMKETPNGRWLWPMLCYLRWLMVLLATLFSLLPRAFQTWVVGLYFGHRVERCCVAASVELLHPGILHNVLYMAYYELLQVWEADVATLQQHSGRLTLYYGASDSWCPLHYREQLLARLPALNAQLCPDALPHTFVLSHSRLMADKLVAWMNT